MLRGIKLGSAGTLAILALASVLTPLGSAAEEKVRPVPLGGAISDQEGERHYGVYVPTRFGGKLTIKASSGTIENLVGPDGRARTNGDEVGDNQHGWYTFKVVKPERKFAVESEFVQVGLATRLPWNFYYWPTKADAIHEPWAGGNARVDTMQAHGDDIMVATPGGYIAPGQDIVRAGANGLLETPVAAGDDSTWFPNLYDDTTFRGANGSVYQTPSPLLKYDHLFNSSARAWEAANSQNQDIQRWPGHCLGGAVASILLNEPIPAPGSGLTRDELKSLWAELGENHYNHRIGEYANEIPAGPPRPGWDPCDQSTAKFHSMLERHIRGQKRALLGNLRAFPPRGTMNEVWNHGIGKYTAKYHAVPGRTNRHVRLEVELAANSGSSLNGNDDKPRLVTYEYTLTYGHDGKIDEADVAANDWIGLGGEAMFAPLNIMEVAETRWAGHNPYVTEANVRSIDMANGGAGGRFASLAAPSFRPVSTYEAGRPQFPLNSVSNRIDSGSPSADGASPRRGLFRIFGRGN